MYTCTLTLNFIFQLNYILYVRNSYVKSIILTRMHVQDCLKVTTHLFSVAAFGAPGFDLCKNVAARYLCKTI